MGENEWKKDVSLRVDGCNWLIYSWQLLKKVNFKTFKSKLDDAAGAKGIHNVRLGSQ